MWSRLPLFVLLAVLLALPFVLRTRRPASVAPEAVLVVITPHNEAIRHEFGAAFVRWYRARTGRTVAVDWRVVGGTSDIALYLRAQYLAAFEAHWMRALGRSWSREVEQASLGDAAAAASPRGREARQAFLKADLDVGIDVLFGGGRVDFEREAAAGRLATHGARERHPDWFVPEVLPADFAGEPLLDPQGRWVGTALSGYGILYNRDAMARLGLSELSSWSDLADPRLIGQVALADPTRSASVAKAFEMIVQQQIYQRARELRDSEADPVAREARAVREGWLAGLRLIQLAGANARAFTDSSQNPPIDVAQGDAAAGLCIDFYGRYEEEAMVRREGGARVKFVTPRSGSARSVDAIAILRGAPHRALAEAFVDFVLSPEGQALWNLRVGTPGGPERFALRRLPVRRDFYERAELVPLRSDPLVNPFAEAEPLVYHGEWTGGLLRELSFVIRALAIDPHPELQDAWREILKAGRPPLALRQLTDLSAVDYDRVAGEIKRRLAARDKLEEMRLAEELARTFRRNYRDAAASARGGR